ncbi:terminase small subunit [Acetobacterium wieringae]|uniref:terminase small subunit n=1 Tax=Acetobacterium wieringae TaxID=52694 RepID=UPI0026EFF88B|nr:terminase small subunit [Acetobacterium wieringae]
MTEKQKRFADEYLIDLNATRAYKAAYPNVKKDETARVNGSRMLTNANVKSYIDKKIEEIQSDKTADAQEVMEYLTSVMRREKSEFIVVTCKERVSDYDENGKKRIIEKEMPEVVEIPAKLSDANKAAELLGKRYRLYRQSQSLLRASRYQCGSSGHRSSRRSVHPDC